MPIWSVSAYRTRTWWVTTGTGIERTLSLMEDPGLRFQVGEDGQLSDVVEHDEGEERDQHYKCGLVNAFLHNHADVAAHDALNHQQQNQSAIEDRERH